MARRSKAWPADAVKRRKVADLVPSARNARTHSEAQIAQLVASIREWGWTMPVLVDETGGIIAGHGRVLAAESMGLKTVPTMTATDWSDERKRAYAIADNQIAINAGWDADILAAEMDDLKLADFDTSLIGFNPGELDEIMAQQEDEPENYSRKIRSPVYEPSGDCPPISSLCDQKTAHKLRDEIRKANLNDEISQFLMLAADRHTVFDFQRIADYYAHAPEAVQKLMEKSALIIIDFKQAIEGGFVVLSKKLLKQYDVDYKGNPHDNE